MDFERLHEHLPQAQSSISYVSAYRFMKILFSRISPVLVFSERKLSESHEPDWMLNINSFLLFASLLKVYICNLIFHPQMRCERLKIHSFGRMKRWLIRLVCLSLQSRTFPHWKKSMHTGKSASFRTSEKVFSCVAGNSGLKFRFRTPIEAIY